MKRVLVPLADGFEEIETVTVIDVLRRAGISVVVASVTGKLSVTGSHQINIVADELIGSTAFSAFDMIVLPGGMPGTKNLSLHEELKEQLVRFNDEGKLIGAICAAPMIPGQLGLLLNREATCYPGYEKYLAGAKVTGKAVSVAGNIVTGKGAGVSMQFALKIVELLQGKETADSQAAKLQVES